MSASYLLFVLLTLGLVAFFGHASYRTAALLPHWPSHINPLLHPAEVTSRLLIIVVCVGLGLLSGRGPVALGWQLPTVGLWAQVGGGLLAGLALAGVYIVTTRWVIAQSQGRYYSPLVVRVIIPRTRRELGGVALAMIGVVVMEELLFRSLLLAGFAPLLPTWLLLGLTGVLFGLMHSPQGPWGMVAIAAGGVLLGIMLVTTGSLLLPAITHYVANLAQIIYVYARGLPPELAAP